MKISVACYGVGNMHSITKAVRLTGAEVRVAKTPSELFPADGIILPGVGSFSAGSRWFVEERERVAERMREVPVLGICLGCQLLLDSSEEGAGRGLSLIPGTVRRLSARKVPNTGWERVYTRGENMLFSGIQNGEAFYFVHSFVPVPANSEDVAASTTLGWDGGAVSFVSAVAHENIFGVQFHPEKSSKQGLRLIGNFVEYCRRVNLCR
ncbi:MAG: imidazole glycerol phosphate synthase subunit HisH [Candidatus Thermoplasmatota archaeon]|nr:imidazole glycerol phosphate synthase subunit HisH [Candidatus Thermoplasmatota archaeon]